MAVVQFTRFSGGQSEDVIANAKKAKVLWMKHGAEIVYMNRFHTGQWTGQWLFVVRFPDWATYGKAQEGVSKDPEFQKLLAHVLTIAKLEGRSVLVGADI